MENHRFQIVWSQPAKKDFEKTVGQIAEVAPMTAAKFGEDMLRRIARLDERPNRCPTLYETPSCRYLLFKKYRIVFQIDDAFKHVYIIAILFPYQQFSSLRML